MNYKDIIRSRKTRIKIMQFLSFVPDKLMLKIQYRIKMGRKLNLKNPQRYTEKLQWYKLYYKNPLMTQCVDKYDVREYLTQRGFGEFLNEIYGVYENPSEINFDLLPESFVIKDTLGGGGVSVIVVSDKTKIDINKIQMQLQEWVNEPIDAKSPGREWVYDGKRHRILIEKNLCSNEDTRDLTDYKFYCFNGKCEYVFVMKNRVLGQTAKKGIFDRDFRLLPYVYAEDDPLDEEIRKPNNYSKMVEVAEEISKSFPHARIDLYNIDGRILFGEITFFPGSGYLIWKPEEFDYEVGKKFNLVLMK